MKTYYTKCGRQFEKSSTATVTGYPIPDGDKQCEECPFRVEVKEGWPPVFKRWECRAGSKEPNHKTDWVGSLEDKNSININSLDHKLLEEIRQFCTNHTDLSAGYNSDHLADCRRTLSVCCSSNKKGIAAKKELIEKFFPTGPSIPDERFEPDVCGDCSHLVDDGSCVTGYGRCDYKHRRMAKDHVACTEFKQAILPRCKMDDCPFNDREGGCCFAGEDPESDGYHRDLIGAVDGYGCTNTVVMLAYKSIVEPEACNNQEAEGNEIDPKEVNDLKCTKHRCPFNNDEISECGFNPITDDAHRPQMEEALYEYKCTNSELLKVLRKMDETCEGCCYLHKSEICNNTNNQRRATPETPRCGWYWNTKTGKMGPLHFEDNEKEKDVLKAWVAGEVDEFGNKVESFGPDEAEANLVKSEDPAPAATFDYSTVDNDTATFLQEKEQKITQIRMMSVMAIGKELKEVHEKLANNRTGTFQKWCKSIGISDDTANRYIRAFDYITANCGNIEAAENIQPSLLFAVSKPSAPKELQEKVLSGDITTHKQYKELEQKLKDAEARAELERNAYERVSESYNRLEKTNHKHYETAEQLRKELESVKQQGVDPEKIKRLEADLKEAQRQVKALTDEQNQPVNLAPAVVHETPPEVQEELEQLRAKVDISRDYNYISDALSKLIVLKPGMIDNWTTIAEQNATTFELGQMLGNLGDVKTTIGTMMSKLQDILRNK